MKQWFFKGMAEDQEVTGTLHADTAMEAYERVRERGLKPMRVCETGLPGPEEQSYECLAFGFLSLVPLFGIFAARHAMRLFRDTTVRGGWNPLRAYLYGGFMLAWFGWPVSIAALALYLLPWIHLRSY